MKQNASNIQLQRKRKALLVAPLLVLPFLTLFFWAMGGGRGTGGRQTGKGQSGLNRNLPDAQVKAPGTIDKMGYYSRAAQDSAARQRLRSQDPYTASTPLTDTPGWHFQADITGLAAGARKPAPESGEAQVYQKLAELQEAVDQPQRPARSPSKPAGIPLSPLPNRTAPRSPDPELQQMNSLLEHILDIQHPERVSEETRKNRLADTLRFKAIPAAIDGNQKVTQGSVIRIRLLDSVTVKGQHLAKGQLVFGTGSLYNQRMAVSIKTVRIGYTILPVDLTVYDMTDGLEGISVPEAVTNEAVKAGADNGVQSLQLMSLDASVGAQAATAGINAARGLFSRKLKRIKARLKNGHPLLLRANPAGSTIN